MDRSTRGGPVDQGFADAGMDDDNPALWNIRHDITPMFGRMTSGLFPSQISCCDPGHISRLQVFCRPALQRMVPLSLAPRSASKAVMPLLPLTKTLWPTTFCMFNRDFFTFIFISVIVVNSRLMRPQSSASTGLEMIDIAIWVIVLLLGAIVYIVWHGLQITRAQHQSTMAGLSSLGDTHKLGYEALTLTMQRLEQRVRQLEERR